MAANVREEVQMNKASIRALLIWSAVAAQVVLVAMTVLYDGLKAGPSVGPDFVLADIGRLLISILMFPAVGIIIFSQRPQHPIGWLFCVMNLGWAINNFAGSYVRYGLSAAKPGLPALDLVAWLYTWPGDISLGLLLLMVLLFPDGTLLSHRWRPVAWLIVGVAVAASLAQALGAGTLDSSIGVAVNNPVGLPGPVGELLSIIGGLSQIALVVLFIVAAVSMLLRLRRARGQERQQLKWFTSGFTIEAILGVVSLIPQTLYDTPQMPLWGEVLSNAAILGTALVPITAGIAILKHRLYEIDIIINRTLVYGTLTGSLLLFYLGSVVLLQALLAAFTSQSRNDLVIVISTLVIVALFTPLRRRIQSFIDKRFYRRKYNAARTLATFSATVRDEVDLGSLTNRLVEVVEETMQPAQVSLWLRNPERKA